MQIGNRFLYSWFLYKGHGERDDTYLTLSFALAEKVALLATKTVRYVEGHSFRKQELLYAGHNDLIDSRQNIGVRPLASTNGVCMRNIKNNKMILHADDIVMFHIFRIL